MLTRAVTALGAGIAAAALLTAVALIWLVLADPVAVANAVGGRGIPAFVQELAEAIVVALEQVVRWL
jgi:hypothetical protein